MAKKIDITKHDKNLRIRKVTGSPLAWRSPDRRPFQLAGFAWFDRDHRYRRMPVKPSQKLPPAVDDIANCTAGGQIRFRTDSKRLALRVRIAPFQAQSHMTAIAQRGFDCYIDGRFARSTGLDVTRLDYESLLFEFEPKMRDITINFPLYNYVKKVEVGTDRGARVLSPRPFRDPRRVVCYGTSITQGGCANRPGMAYTNILSRWLDLEVLNHGYSGSGKGEPEVALLLSEIPRPACFVLDYEGNVETTEKLAATLPEFIRILRAAHPKVPILVVSCIPFAQDLTIGHYYRERIVRNRIQRETVERFRKWGDRRVFFLDGRTSFFGRDFEECTVDGVHPTDLGFMKMAETLFPLLQKIMKETLGLAPLKRTAKELSWR